MKRKRFLKIYVEITNGCNLNCSFCSKSNREIKFMTTNDFSIVAGKIAPYTNLIALHIKGEPLLHPELREILNICEKNNLKVNITTNGTLILKQLNTILNSRSIRQLNISLHSASQNGLEIKLYLENILKAVKEIKSKTDIIISYRLWNLLNLEENSVNKYALEMLGEEYQIFDIVNKAKENEFIELHKNIFLNQDIEFEWPDIDGKIISKKGKCYGLRNQIGILSNGDIVPCCLDSEANIKLGNIYENEIEEVINTDKAKSIIEGFQKGILVEELCQKCGFIKRFP